MSRFMKLIALIYALAALTALSSCASATTPIPQATSPVPPTAISQSPDQQHPEVGSIELKVMTFNIWLGGEVVDFNKVIEVIKQSGADIVGLQEAEGNTGRIAAALGWHANERLMLISRFPLIEPPDAERSVGVDYLYAQIAPGQVIAVSNIHLTSDPYGPYAVRDGEDLEFVIEQEQGLRVPEIEERLASWQELIASGVPLFVTGDFNTPSHLDWTSAMVGSLPHIRYAVEWPVTLAMKEAGFVDTFRTANPDPVANPGRTWTYGYPYPRVDGNEAIDRIDYVFASSNAQVLASQVIGEPGTPNVDIGVSPYPSDHRAVVSTLQVTPVEPPLFIAVDHMRLVVGDRLVVRYHAPAGDATDRLAVVAAGGTVPQDELMWLPPQEAEFYGAVRFGTGGLAAGAYDVVLVGVGDQELSRRPFWIVAADALPEITVAKPVFKAGETIAIEWANAPAHMRDWVGIYPAGNLDLYNGYLAFSYTGATVAGEYSFGPDDLGEAMLPAGDYIAVLVADDGYALLAQVPFSVEP